MDLGMDNRLGILGGTFNPVHTGHLILAQCAAEAFDLGKVLFLPAGLPPHKESTMLAAPGHRLAMLEMAIEGDLRFEVSDIELERGGTSYAVDTAAELHRAYPDAELCFIVGADTLPELHSWRNIYTLLRLCRFITLGRPGFDITGISPHRLRLDPPWPERLLKDYATGYMVDISSSDIRHRVAEGMSIRYLVPRAVEMYIAEHGLYRG
jgi:nicotinate-nucleotide adenylyltransferase